MCRQGSPSDQRAGNPSITTSKRLSEMKAFFDLSIFFSIMYYVYILKSEKSGIYYTGIAKNINLRLKDYNRGKSKFTKGHSPWKLIYSEGPYETSQSIKIEKHLINHCHLR